MTKRPGMARRATSCFVHGFLQDDRLSGDTAPYDNLDHVPEEDHMACDKNPHGHEDAGMQSRLLTKKQLSDMAFSIRELSKRLGRFKLKLKVNNVFLLTKAHDSTLIKNTREVAEWLLSDESGGPYTVYVTVNSARLSLSLMNAIDMLRKP